MHARHGMTGFARLVYALLASTLLGGCFLDSDNDSTPAPSSPPSDDAALSALSAAPAALNPSFAAGITSYSASVSDDISSVQLVATPRDGGASLARSGSALTAGAPGVAVALVTGSNLVEVVVTAADGSTTRTYTIEIERAPPALSDDATLAGLELSAGTLDPAFDPAITVYSASVDAGTESVQLTAEPGDAGATLSFDGSPLAAGAASAPVALTVGSNPLSLLVTAADGSTTATYSIDVVRAEPPPAVTTTTLQLLVLDADGEPVDGALVTADELPDSALTDTEGRTEITALAVEGAILRLSRSGFVDQLLRLDLAGGSAADTPLRVGMVRRASPQGFAADQPAVLTGADGARVELPANAFVDAFGNPVSGQVDAFITPLNISSSAGLAAFPGGFAARGPGDEPGSLVTLGLVEFSFEQDGQRLQLAPGVIATLEIPVYVSENLDGSALQPNDPIPLWELDESDATWNYEGEGLLVAAAGSPSGLALRGTASHFSWWNADLFVARTGGSSPGGIFESWLLPVLSCDEPGTPCTTTLPGQEGAWVQATILGLNGPRRSTARWVPFAADEEQVGPISIPTGVNIGVTASVSDGYYAVDSVTPDPVRSESGGETIVADVLLRPRHLVDDGLFVPGERLRGLMTEIGEVHSYRFEGRANRVFRLRGYPAASASAGPGISADLGATVRLWQDGNLLDEALFDEATAAEIDVLLPADGEYVVTITADGKVPNFYVATTALLIPAAQAGGTVAFPARADATLAIGLYVMDGNGESFVRLSPVGTGATCLSPTTFSISCPGINTLGHVGDLTRPGWVPRFIQRLPAGEIAYVSDHDRPGFVDLFAVSPAEPQLATRLSGAEVAGPEGSQVVDFRSASGRPGRIVYKVAPRASTLGANAAGELYVVERATPEQSRRALPLADGRSTLRHEFSKDGRWVVYLGLLPDSSAAIDLYAIDLDAPGSQPVRVNAPLDYVAGERMVSFAISPDSRWFTYTALENIDGGGTRRQAYLVDLLDPGVATRISALIHTRTMEARFSPDGQQLVYRNAASSNNLQGNGDLYLVDLGDPGQPGAPVLLPKNNAGVIISLSSDAWQISPRGDQVIVVTQSRLFGFSLDNPGTTPVELLRVPSSELRIDNAGWPVFTDDGDGVLLPTTDLSAANLPSGLIHQRFGDPVDGYRTLLTSADFPAGSRGVTQVALSVDGTAAVVLTGQRSAGAPVEILSVPLGGEPPVLLVPYLDEAQGLRVRTIDGDRGYQFLPLGN